MLEKVIELLLGIAVAAAGAVGLATAGDAIAKVDAAATAMTKTTDLIPGHAAEHRADAPRGHAGADADAEAAVEAESQGVDGRATAAAAIEAALELAPDAATFGLENAWAHVSGEAGAPEALPDAADAGAAVDVDAMIDAHRP